MKKDLFFADVRKNLFGGSLTADQVNGMEALIDVAAIDQLTDDRQLAYILATPMIETGGKFLPIVESLNYSELSLNDRFGRRITPSQSRLYGRNNSHPADQRAIANIIYGGDWGKKNLGNVNANDGWDFRGRGLCQITGRANYTKFERLLGLPLTTQPDLATQVNVAAKIMVIGMRDGLFTGHKLSDYFNTVTNWVAARAIINGGGDRAQDIANDAIKFLHAIKGAV